MFFGVGATGVLESTGSIYYFGRLYCGHCLHSNFYTVLFILPVLAVFGPAVLLILPVLAVFRPPGLQ